MAPTTYVCMKLSREAMEAWYSCEGFHDSLINFLLLVRLLGRSGRGSMPRPLSRLIVGETELPGGGGLCGKATTCTLQTHKERGRDRRW